MPHVIRRFARPLALALADASLFTVSAGAVPTHLGERSLSAGTRGPDVRSLQQTLTRVGYRTLADGVFAAGTARRVRSFQRRAGLRPTGVVRRADARALRRALRGGPGDRRSLGARPLRPGSRGHDVRVLQAFLTSAGFPVTVDGVHGSGTARQVLAFQRARRLGVDGVVGPTVVAALRRAHSAARPAVRAHARLTASGLAVAPAGAPAAVRRVIAAGNRIARKPYRYGGGHGRFKDSGYDCSGSISYALHGGGLLRRALDSSGLTGFGSAGRGRWITIYAHGGHAYMVVAGLRFDTSGRSGAGSRWQRDRRRSAGYRVRHPDRL